jgi:ribose-phosphate pyrophosphokinase
MCDDMISTAGTVCGAAKLVKDMGAEKIYVGASHGVFSGAAIEKLRQAPIDEIVVTDTIAINSKVKELANLTILSVSELLGEAIKRIHRNESVSSIFKMYS